MESELLEKQLKENRMKFRVDHFDIIIMEYMSKYNRGLLYLDPPYQRMYRWGIKDQSALIESMILGVPLPSFFVFQKDDGRWELIDGLQRTMTIIKFMSKESFKLKGLEILTELNDKTINEMPHSIKIRLENSRIRVEIIEDSEEIYSQYLLFSRLNSNGEKLEDQEKRNFLIYKKNPKFYEKLQEISKNEDFLNVLNWDTKEIKDDEDILIKSVRQKKIDKQENVEYVLKFLIARYIAKRDLELRQYPSISSFINENIIEYLDKISPKELENEYKIFLDTFKTLNLLLGEDTLKLKSKKVNNIANRFTVTCGISFIEKKNDLQKNELKNKIESYYISQEFKKYTKSSYNPVKRLYDLNKYSKKFFQEEIDE